MIKTLLDFAVEHKAAVMVAEAWVVREVPVVYRWIVGTVYPALVKIYPFFKANGGVRGVVSNFFVGEPKNQNTNTEPK